MKNKGRIHKAGSNVNDFAGIGNCKGALVADTRDIRKMGKNPFYERGVSKKFTKKKWSKRVRGYFKSQTKNIGLDLINDNMSYTITWEQQIGGVDNPLDAAKECLSQIQKSEALAFTVTDNETGKSYSVDLSEPDTDAVLQINK